MGKSYHHHHHHHHRRDSGGLSLDDNRSPGCMSGILHHFHHQRRNHIKKRLPHRKHTAPEHNSDPDSIRTASEDAEIQEIIDRNSENLPVDIKPIEPSPAPKSSMKSRIKALISEEMSKRRGRHRRCSSDPIRTQQLERTNSIHHLEPSDQLLSPSHTPIALLDSPVLNRNNGSSCDLCMLNYLKQSEVGRNWHQPVRDHTLLQDKSIYAIEPSKYASIQESKLFLDALDLLNMRKEVFLKILQDPISSLAHQFHGRRTRSSLRSGLTKSVSFPVPGRGIQLDKSINGSRTRQEDLIMENGVQDFSNGDSTTSSATMLRKQHESKVALKRFKNIREKIKHVIREKKKEKRRIVMDGVLHKIPYGLLASKDTEDSHHVEQEFKVDKYGKHSPRNSCSESSHSQRKDFKRTCSFHESPERYNRLLDITCGREDEKNKVSDRLRSKTGDTPSPIPSRPAMLSRILSLPDIRSYSYFQIEDSPGTSLFDAPARNISVGSVRLSERKAVGIGLENRGQLSESGSQDNFLDVGETLDDSADSKTWESASCHDSVLESGQVSAYQSSKSDVASETDSVHEEDDRTGQTFLEAVSEELGGKVVFLDKEASLHEDNLDSSTASKGTVEINEALETQAKIFYDELRRVQVDIKNNAEFNYVKDVLELSGFSRDEILGKWHSAERPVNPSVFDEVEGCLIVEPGCLVHEEDGSCDHLLLFDLINEALLSIHERSFFYWPKPLTCRSLMRRMPIGHHVLEEVWGEISLFLSWRPEVYQTIDDAVVRDLAKGDGWMNLQFDAECVGLEMEDLIFDEILEEIIST